MALESVPGNPDAAAGSALQRQSVGANGASLEIPGRQARPESGMEFLDQGRKDHLLAPGSLCSQLLLALQTPEPHQISKTPQNSKIADACTALCFQYWAKGTRL